MDPINGNNIDLSPAPKPEDFYASTNSYLEVILYAKDEETGLTGKAVRLVQPSLVTVGIDSFPPGLIVRVDDEPVTAYQTIVSWKEQDLELIAEDQPPYIFVSWSDGSTDPNHSIRLNYSEPAVTAVFCSEGPCTEDLECCSGICFQDTCVDEESPETEPSSSGSSPSQGNGSDATKDPNANATTTMTVFFVVIGVVVVVGAAACFTRTVCLKSKQQPFSTPLEVHPGKCDDEEAPLAGNPSSNADASINPLSEESKPDGSTVVTQDSATIFSNNGQPLKDAHASDVES